MNKKDWIVFKFSNRETFKAFIEVMELKNTQDKKKIEYMMGIDKNGYKITITNGYELESEWVV